MSSRKRALASYLATAWSDDEAAVNKVIGVLGSLESHAGEAFNRSSDTLLADTTELNFKFVFQGSPNRVSPIPTRV